MDPSAIDQKNWLQRFISWKGWTTLEEIDKRKKIVASLAGGGVATIGLLALGLKLSSEAIRSNPPPEVPPPSEPEIPPTIIADSKVQATAAELQSKKAENEDELIMLVFPNTDFLPGSLDSHYYNYLLEKLQLTKEITLVSRDTLQQQVEEIKFSQEQLSSPVTQLKFGKILGASHIVFLDYSIDYGLRTTTAYNVAVRLSTPSVNVSLKIVDIETSRELRFAGSATAIEPRTAEAGPKPRPDDEVIPLIEAAATTAFDKFKENFLEK